MPSFYSPSSSSRTLAPKPYSTSLSSSSSRVSRPKKEAVEPGKFTIDLTDPVGSIGGSLQSAGMLAGGLVGGALGIAGQVGIPGGPNLGDIPEAAGDVLGAAGRVGLGGRLPTNPTLGGTLGGGGEANIGAIPGAMLDVVGLPGRAVERTVAGMRVEAAQKGERNFIADAINNHMALLMGPVAALMSGAAEEGSKSLTGAPESIPADLQEALDAGKMTADQVADEMVGRSAGFSNNPIANLGASVVYDPLNLAGGAVGKIGTTGQRAGVAVRAGESANPAQWMVGKTYNAATHAMTEGQQAVATKFVGPATSGIFHALGSKPFLRLTGKAESLAPEYGQAVADGVAYGNAQIVRAVMADQIADDAAKGLLKAEQFESPDAVANLIEQRVLDMKELNPKQVERSAEEMMLRVAHKFENKSAEEIASETARKLARMTGMPEQDAARIIAGDMREAQTVHLGFYGYLGHKLEQAKAASRDLSALRSTVDDSGTILPGQEAASQAENVAQGVARGGTPESGGAVRAEAAPADPDPFSAQDQIRELLAEQGGVGKWWGDERTADVYKGGSGSMRVSARFRPEDEARFIDPEDASGVVAPPDAIAHITGMQVNINETWHDLPVPPNLFAPIGSRAVVTGSENAAEFTGKELFRSGEAGVHPYFWPEESRQPVTGVTRQGEHEISRTGSRATDSPRQTIDYERLTLIAPETLTLDRAAELEALTGQSFAEGVLRYSILRKYHGAAYDEAKVRDLIKTLRDRDALPTTVKAQTRDKPNALPSVIGDVRKEAEEFGYELGFSPKSGWRVVTDADGNIIVSDPFVHFVSDATPVTVRNPIGRFVDSLTRGVTQTRIILDSRRRLVEQTRKLGISGREAEEIHRRLLHSARDESVAPRGLAMSIPKRDVVAGKPVKLNRFDDEFLAVLGPDRFAALIEKHDPATLAMRAFEGDLSRIGLTQKVSGRGKALPIQFGGMPVAAAVAEGLYPLMRFRLNPLFQAQELVESPFWNLLRGVSKEGVPDDLADTYARLADLEDAKWISEAGFTLNIAGGDGIKRSLGQGPIGKMLNAIGVDVRGTKEAARMSQILTEHPEQFREAVERLNPRIWKVMEEAYGTTDAKLVTEAFLRERTAQTGGNLKAALATFDEARPTRATTVEELASEGYVFHGSAVDPRTSGGAVDAAGFFTTTEPEYANLYAKGTIKNSAEAAANGRVYATKLPPASEIGNLADPAIQSKVKDIVAADVAALRDQHEFMGAVERAAKRVAEATSNAQDVGGERTLISALSDYAISRAKLLNPEAGIDNTFAGETLRKLGYKVLKFPDESMESVGGAAGRFAPTYVWTEKPPLSPVDDLLAKADQGSPAADAAMETVWNAFRYSFEKASTTAFRTHYFSTSRSFLERSVNHPYLGLYPASYMWGKVLPEFARFLLLRPFGQKAPLVGLAAWQKVQEAFVASTADPEFRGWLEENKDAVYLANMLLPGLPSHMPVNAPAYGRHIAEDTLAGRDVTANTIAREVTDTASYAFGPVRGTETILKGLFDAIDNAQGAVEDNLDVAARMYDGMFPQTAVAP